VAKTSYFLTLCVNISKTVRDTTKVTRKLGLLVEQMFVADGVTVK